MKNKCGYVMPNHGLLEPVDGCELEEHHKGEHLQLIQDGRFVLWEYEHDCDCTAEEIEECECFLYHEISPARARRMLKKASRK